MSQVSLLCRIASSLPQKNEYFTLLKSCYLMRCQEITKGFGLPVKNFSSYVRCGKCCTEWKKGTEITVTSIKLSKKQRQRIQSQKLIKSNKHYGKTRKDLLHSNQMEQVCLFCKHRTITLVPKPERTKNQPSNVTEQVVKIANNHTNLKQMQVSKRVDKIEEASRNRTCLKKIGSRNVKSDSKKSEVNVYSEAKDVFSLKHKKNTIASAVKKVPKVIKNNKKKKDKFAGLCQKAVLASVQLKQEKQEQTKLKLFLKPSSG